MRIGVSTAELKSALDGLLQSAAKVCVNFTYDSGCLYLQVNAGIVIEKMLKCLIEDSGVKISISVMVDRGVGLLLRDGVRTVYLTQVGSVLFLQQEGLEITLAEQPEDRTLLPSIEKDKFHSVRISEFKKLLRVTRIVMSMAKALAVPEVPIVVYAGKVYIVFSNTAFVMGIELPDMQVSYDLLRKAVNAISGEAVEYYLDANNGTLWLSASSTKISLPVSEVYIGDATAIDKVVEDMQPCSKLNVSSFAEALKNLCSVKKSGNCIVTVDSSRLHLSIENNTTHFEYGAVLQNGVVIQLSMPQLAVLASLYGEETEVQVRKGNNLLCMMSQSLKSRLLLAGLNLSD